ncbi:hypothetical protein [Oscillatoria salina]|uniref:hypothetical protein n=1 Tax=Oscillatoria salina TaxID=331517 RepID=UPI0013BE5BA6|nr:hypothetical protein [Oscillatoria salina]MBZ8180002.1 hypothetical protein [Oscillatoria salina IIICB1]NET91117.1 hypothetical protein [Kamptonema sp. SIO1D9]
MTKITVEKEVVLSRLLEIVEKLMQSDPFLQERIDKTKLSQILAQALDKVSLEELIYLSEKELIKIVNKIMVRQAVSGTLNELDREQKEIFEVIVEGK